MTTSTLFSAVSENQNQAGPFVPANTVVDTGATPPSRASFTLTVTPATGWARASVGVSSDNLNFNPLTSIEVAPSPIGVGSETDTSRVPLNGRYFAATAMTVSPGAAATLTITY